MRRILEFLIDFAAEFNRDNPGDARAVSQAQHLPALSRSVASPWTSPQAVSEAISTSSFKDYLVRVAQRKLSDQYELFPRLWQSYCLFESTPSRNKSVQFGVTRPIGGVETQAELTDVKRDEPTVTKQEYQVVRRSMSTSVSSEALIDDDLGTIMQSINELANATMDLENEIVTKLFQNTTSIAWLRGLGTVYHSGATAAITVDALKLSLIHI